MLQHWLIELMGHASGFSEAQLRQIEKSLPASKALIDLLARAQPVIEQAQKLYLEAEPLIHEAIKELQAVGPAAQILIDVLGHHVDKGRSPAEAAEAVRTTLDGSVGALAPDPQVDRQMRCVTVFGGTGFVGRRVVRQLAGSGVTVRVASRHPGPAKGGDIQQIAVDVHDEGSIEAAVAGSMAWSTPSASMSSTAANLHAVHVETAAAIAGAARRAGARRFVHLSGIGVDAASPSPYLRVRAKARRRSRPPSPARSSSARR